MGRKFTLTANADGDLSTESFGGLPGGQYAFIIESTNWNGGAALLMRRKLNGTDWVQEGSIYLQDWWQEITIGEGAAYKLVLESVGPGDPEPEDVIAAFATLRGSSDNMRGMMLYEMSPNADGDPSLESFGGIRGGRYEVLVEAAVWNAATVVIQMRNLRGTAWGDISNEFTEDGSGVLDFGQGDILKARVTGGVPVGLRIALRQFA